ncbi:MAG TPA: ABC transporter ATP-binding protein [Caulobacteraceae bacterium]|jgi:iron complex transport system ATP-binding protein
MNALEVEHLSVDLGGRTVLVDAALVVPEGSLTAVVGGNGAGKTTLLRGALGLVAARGSARLFGEEVARLSPRRRAERVGYLAQERRVAWGMTARRIAALGAVTQPPRRADALGDAALARVGSADLAHRSVFDMSGGERARVLLARLLATGAPLLVLDEPAAGLDPDAQLATLELLRDEARAGRAVVVTLHDLTLAARFCTRVVVLDKGRVVADDAPVRALSPEVLRSAFALEGGWADTPAGPVLAAQRSRTNG